MARSSFPIRATYQGVGSGHERSMNRKIRIGQLIRWTAGMCGAGIAATLSAAVALAQEQPQQQQPAAATAPSGDDVVATGAVIKKESRLVLVDAVVTDKKGKYVRDLAQSDFRVYEDNKEQALTSFSTGTSQD